MKKVKENSFVIEKIFTCSISSPFIHFHFIDLPAKEDPFCYT